MILYETYMDHYDTVLTNQRASIPYFSKKHFIAPV